MNAILITISGINHSLGEGFYCSFDGIDKKTLPEVLEKIEINMRKDIESKFPIVRHKVQFVDALYHFAAKGREDKCNLLKFQNNPKIAIYHCDNFTDLAHGALADNTKDLQHFKLIQYDQDLFCSFLTRAFP